MPNTDKPNVLKRASYRDAIDWIAQMDSAGDDDAMDPEVASSLITAVLVADIFGASAEKVGRDVVRRRQTLKKEEERARTGRTAWLGEALGPCVVRGYLSLSPAMCALGGDPSKSACETRLAVLLRGGWALYEPQDTEAFCIHATEAQALAWCARGVRP